MNTLSERQSSNLRRLRNEIKREREGGEEREGVKTGRKADGGRKVAKEAGQSERQEKNTERE